MTDNNNENVNNDTIPVKDTDAKTDNNNDDSKIDSQEEGQSSSNSPSKTGERFSRPVIPEPTRSFKITKSLQKLILRPGGGNPYHTLKPGGLLKLPKEYVINIKKKSQKKKLGKRKNYTMQQLLSIRDKFKKIPLGIESLDGVFEEGLGDEVGRNIGNDMLVGDNIMTNMEDNSTNIKDNIVLSTDDTNKLEGDNKPSKKFINTSKDKNISTKELESDKKIALSSHNTGWVPPHLRGQITMDPTEIFIRKIRPLLNKLTLDNFEILKDKLIKAFDDEVNDADKLQMLVSLMFEKAIEEPLWGPLYARLCVTLSDKKKIFTYTFEDENGLIQQKNDATFRHILLKQCEKEFRQGVKPPIFNANANVEEKLQAQSKQKKLLMGTIIFIGQLFNHELLPSQIMLVCLQHLLGDSKPNEEDVEGACNLLETVGKKLDEKSMIKEKIEIFYKKLIIIEKNLKDYSTRITILITNLLDLRKQNWNKPHKSELKTVAQIRNEWVKERGNIDMMKNKPNMMNKMNNLNTLNNNNNNDLSGGGNSSDNNANQQEVESEILYTILNSDNANMNTTLNVNNINDYDVVSGGALAMSANALARTRNKDRQWNRYAQQQPSSQPSQQQIPIQSSIKQQELLRQNVLNRNKINSNKITRKNNLLDLSDAKLPTNEPSIITSTIPTIIPNVSIPTKTIPKIRPGSKGEEFNIDQFEQLYKTYLEEQINEQQLMNKIMNCKIDVKSYVLKIIDLGTQRNLKQQIRAGHLLNQLIHQFFILSEEADQALKEYFEFYSSTLQDDPQLAEHLSYILAPLFANEILSLQLLQTYLKLDSQMNKPYRKDSQLDMKSELLGHLFHAIQSNFSNQNNNIISFLIQKNNFNLNDIVDPKLQKQWIQEFKLPSNIV